MTPNAIDNAIERLQDLALGLTSVTIRSAADYPTENTDPFPMVVAYLGGGQFNATNATLHHNYPSITVEFHFSRTNLKQASQQVNAVALEYPRRIAADPTLDGMIDTVVMGAESPITYTVRPHEWGQVTTQALVFSIPIKTLQTPQATST